MSRVEPPAERAERIARQKEAKAVLRPKPIPKQGPRGLSYAAWERKERVKAKGKPCPICGRENLAPLPARHMIPRSIAPGLETEPENVRFPCVRCPQQPEDAVGVKGNYARRLPVILERYGEWAADYVRANWPGRKG